MNVRLLVPIGLAAGLLGAPSAAEARPSFVVEPEVFAAPGVPCHVYYERVFDSRVPQRYLLEAVSEVGRCHARSWDWTPQESDAGTRKRLVLNAWDDEGLVASATTTVVVAGAPSPAAKGRKVTLALLAASDTNSLYQNRILERMRAAGFANYTPVGTHTGGSASFACNPAEGAPHDGFGAIPGGRS